MLCQECNQRDATVHFTKIVNQEKTEIHLCETCAREKGDFVMKDSGGGFSFHNLLSGLLGFEQGYPMGAPGQGQAQAAQNRCGTCGLTYQQFAQVGRFGCADCYKYFSGRVEPLVRRIHGGATKHTGKVPRRTGGQIMMRKQLVELRQELQQKIQGEQFEEAAVIRDRIRELENEIGQREEM
jgi:protein arginine kinase activator